MSIEDDPAELIAYAIARGLCNVKDGDVSNVPTGLGVIASCLERVEDAIRCLTKAIEHKI